MKTSTQITDQTNRLRCKAYERVMRSLSKDQSKLLSRWMKLEAAHIFYDRDEPHAEDKAGIFEELADDFDMHDD